MAYSQHETIEGDHGRIETRPLYGITAYVVLTPFKCRWSGLQSLVQVENHRQIKGGEYRVISVIISARFPKADLIAKAIRAHWRIENNLQWSLDVYF